MSKMNWGRVIMGGVVAGIVSFVLGGLMTAYWTKDFEAAVTALGRPYAIPKSAGPLISIFLVNLGLGMATVWLYAAIRPRYGPGPKTAAVAGFFIWAVLSLLVAFYMSIGLLPVQALLAPIGVSMAAYIVAAEAGAWFYKE